MNQKQMRYIQEDKIDLSELWQVISRRKTTITVITLLTTLAALAYVLFAKPIYEVRSVIELAQIDNKNIHNSYDIKQKLTFIYEVDLNGKKSMLPIIESISIPKKTESIIVVKAHGYDNESAIKKTEEFITTIKSLQNSKIAGYIDSQNKRLVLLQHDINIIDQSINSMIDKISLYENKVFDIEKKDAALAGIYTIELGKTQTEINHLRTNKSEFNTIKNKLLFSISPNNITRTKEIGSIEILDKPVKPKKALIVIVAFITGLMLSLFLIFFLEFIQSSRKEDT